MGMPQPDTCALLHGMLGNGGGVGDRWHFVDHPAYLSRVQPGGGHIVERSDRLTGTVVGHGGMVRGEVTEQGRRNKGDTLLILLH